MTGTPHLFQFVLPLLQLEVGGDGRVFSRKVGVALEADGIRQTLRQAKREGA